MVKIKEIPKNERPREKALIHGIESLSLEELIALIISSGTRNASALDISRSILSSFPSTSCLENVGVEELITFEGISKAKALKLASVFEISKRIAKSKLESTLSFKEKEEVIKYFHSLLCFEHIEKVCLLILTRSYKLIAIKTLYKGSRTNVNFSPKEICKTVSKCEGDRFYIVHNHPSGNSLPSQEDKSLTNTLDLLSQALDLEMEDHLIIGLNTCYSFKEKKEIIIFP